MANNPQAATGAAAAPAAAPAVTVVPKKYFASIYPTDKSLPDEFGKLITELEEKLELPIWLIVQNDDESDWGYLSREVYNDFRNAKNKIEEGKPVALLLHSGGGQAEYAYKIVRIFQRRSAELTILVPHYAKSAATLMALGGKRIIMGGEAELGPLDVQIYDSEKEDYDSALNAVQSLERLNAYALTALDQGMQLFLARTRKKPDALLPLAITYATGIIKPLVEKIDTIDLTKKSRELKVAEDYAIRLMRSNYAPQVAQRIASHLVERYSTHGFVIDRTEAMVYETPARSKPFGLGLKIEKAKSEIELVFDSLTPHLEKLTVVGRVVER